MSLEDAYATRMTSDGPLLGILAGGVYKWKDIAPLGLRRGEHSPTANAFDADNLLLPCAVVKEGAIVPTGDVVDYDAKIESVRQRVEIWLYQDRDWSEDAIGAAVARLRTLFFGERFDDTFEPSDVMTLARQPDPALKNALMSRMDFQNDFILEMGG